MPEGKEFTQRSEEEIRASVIADYDLDATNEANKPFIDKTVKKELDWQNERMDSHKKLSKAIQQKQDWRKKATEIFSDDEDGDSQPKPKGDDTNKGSEKNDEVESLKSELADIKNTINRSKFSHLTDDEYQTVNAIATQTGKSFEETLTSNPIIKNYLETNKANARMSGGIHAPSSRVSGAKAESEEDRIAKELSDGLPNGF